MTKIIKAKIKEIETQAIECILQPENPLLTDHLMTFAELFIKTFTEGKRDE